jgi:GTPase SAR1 family protein
MMGRTNERNTSVLIVEGPDGSGKTTLVNRLCEELGVEVRSRASTSDDGPIDDLWAWVVRDMGTNTNSGIYDRHPLVSEMIYGSILRGEVRLGDEDPHQLVQILEFFYGMKPLIIYCLPKLKTVRVNVGKNHGHTEHTRGVLRFTDHIYAAYRYRMSLDSLHGVAEHWDYELDQKTGGEAFRHLRQRCLRYVEAG